MKKMLKLLTPILLLAVSFCGCNYESQELKSRLIVQAVGIDALENGGVRVTLQTLNTEMAGNPNSGANLGDIINFVTVEGETVSEAISAAAKSVGKLPLLSQNRLIVFGRETAQKGIYSDLDYFVRNADNRATVLVAVSDTTAEELVSAKMGESVLTANSIEDILKAMQFNTNIINQELYKLINKLECDCSNAFLPVLKVEQENGGEKADIQFVDVAVFDKDQMLFEMENDAVTALMMLHNQVEHGYLSVRNQEFSAETVVKIRHCSVKVKPQSINGVVHFTVRVKMEVDIAEIKTEEPFSINEAYLNETQRLCHEYVIRLLEQETENCFVNHQADPYCLGRRFKCILPKEFKEIPDWKANLPSVKIEVLPKIEINRVGNGAENI